ncbi:ATP-binding protein [Kitasatospora sp. NBC_00240]|uniref:ATP-binding protein n=1 Tax=Kitasatospora sp. NBC_00240 TaxID=2903567 RepID=UPI002251030C|nr:ATP-binding protein [Kitasatospora sp. NBC_00240]MCX5208528.1 ATP-binding protein [Kitasatospora sp. NBC_00240]
MLQDTDTRRLVLASGGGAVGRCREFAREALTRWDWAPAADGERGEVARDVLLIVSELVTNAAQHADGPIELSLTRSTTGLRVEVADCSPEPPVLRRGADPVLPGGHGLRVVDLLSWSWGSRVHEHGKTVWSEIAAPPAELRRRR